MKDIWIDLLCWGSAMKVVRLSRKISIGNIYYVNILQKYSSILIWMLRILTKKPVMQICSIVESEQKIGNTSLYELIQSRLIETLGNRVSQGDMTEIIENYCISFKYNPTKFKEHLIENGYGHLFRIVEIQVLSEKLSGVGNVLLVVRKTPIASLFKRYIGMDKICLYLTIISHRFIIKKRKGYHYDLSICKKYYYDKYDCILHACKLWGISLLNNVVYRLFLKRNINLKNVKSISNIGVELIRSRIKLDEINDIYWVINSGINPRTVFGIEFENYDDKSKEVLHKLGIQRIKVISNPLQWIKNLMKKDDSSCRYVFIGGVKQKNTFFHLLKLVRKLFRWDESAWLLYQEYIYSYNTEKWKFIYDQVKIRTLWSQYDLDSEKLAKAQALENLDGLFMGSHWSNIPIDSIETRKHNDVLFTWGEHFIKNYFNKYPHLGIFIVGYPLDYYFKEKKLKATAIRSKYQGKYLLSYHDNVASNDLPNSKKMQLDIYKEIIALLECRDNLVVFLKPKRKHTLDEVLEALPILKQYIINNRIVVFLGDTPRTKAVPAEIGIACDLVVGLGISTAAAECYFAGTVAFHADFTDFNNNEFGNHGLNKIVFRDIENLRNAIQKQINGEGLSHDDCRKYYEMLDPFQDGKANIRAGFVIKKLQEAFQSGLSRGEAVKWAQKKYGALLDRDFKITSSLAKEAAVA